jgi:hypothetical protein
MFSSRLISTGMHSDLTCTILGWVQLLILSTAKVWTCHRRPTSGFEQCSREKQRACDSPLLLLNCCIATAQQRGVIQGAQLNVRRHGIGDMWLSFSVHALGCSCKKETTNSLL